MRFFKLILPLFLAAAVLISLAGCHRTVDIPDVSAKPSDSPAVSSKPTKDPSGPSSSPDTTDGALNSASPSLSPDASGSPLEDEIEGFMEGVVVDPDNVPHLMEVLAEHGEYRGLAIQSITYKLYEGRQAYYVVLQGEGNASRAVYVFGDDTVIGED